MTLGQTAVIGTVFMDVKGYAAGGYASAGRNLGSIEFVHGGVGRNVAENMARIGIPTAFVSSVDAGSNGRGIVERLEASGIHTAWIQEAERRGMGMWLAILDDRGNLAGSISQMPDLTYIERFIAEKGESFLSACSHIVLELDLNEEISRKVTEIAQLHQIPVFGIPGNLDIVLKHTELLADLQCFICNDIEAGRLCSTNFAEIDPSSMSGLLKGLAKRTKLRSLVVTLGERGSVYFDSASGAYGYEPALPVHVVDTSGAGDAFFSGTVAALIHKLPLSEAVRFGTKIAGWTIESKESTHPDLAELVHRDAFLIG